MFSTQIDNAIPDSYSIKQDTHGFWSPYLNGKVLRKAREGVFRNPPVLCNSYGKAVDAAIEHARIERKG